MNVTVAIPVFNSAATLERCLRSAMVQSLHDIEILVADDGSTDASADIADRLAQQDHRISVVRMGVNGGKPRAMNALVDRARGTWIAVLDADDAYHPERLERLVACAEAAGVEMAADKSALYRCGRGAGAAHGIPRDGRRANHRPGRLAAKHQLLRRIRLRHPQAGGSAGFCAAACAALQRADSACRGFLLPARVLRRGRAGPAC